MNGMRRLGHWLRDGWLIIGSTMLLLIGLEVCYRGQSALRHAVSSPRAPGGIKAPNDSAWFQAYIREYDRTFRLQWKPYVYFRRPPFTGEYITVDSAGHRRTLPGPRHDADTVHVFFFGGSTMWGSYLRDDATIASVTAKRLESWNPDVSFAVTNFGESGYVFTQGMLELELQLRAGNLPDVVVFYDGINDVASAVQRGEAGVPQNELNRAREFEFGRAIYGTETGVGSDWRALRAVGTAVVQRLQFVQRLAAAVSPAALPPMPARLPNDIVQVYAANVDVIEALSRSHGFTALYVWQPTLQTTPKTLTAFEKLMIEENGSSEFQRRLAAVHGRVAPMLDSVISRRVGPRFVDESGLFAGDTSSVFIDNIGHNTEKSIPGIVAGFLPRLTAAIDSIVSVRRRTGSASARRPSRPTQPPAQEGSREAQP